MTKFCLGSSVRLSSIGIRVQNRDLMISFYRDLVGFSLITEENALAIMGTDGCLEQRFFLEESPRAATHFGKIKKMQQFVINVMSIEELTAIAARLKEAVYPNVTMSVNEASVFLTIIDPEENQLVVSFDQATESEKLDQQDISIDSADQSVRLQASFKIAGLALNARDVEQEEHFLTTILGLSSDQPLAITVNACEDEVAGLPGHEVIGLEFVRLLISEADLVSLEEHIVAEEYAYFIDKKKKILIVEDTTGFEWWFDRV